VYRQYLATALEQASIRRAVLSTDLATARARSTQCGLSRRFCVVTWEDKARVTMSGVDDDGLMIMMMMMVVVVMMI
jgi:hypothetical protein